MRENARNILPPDSATVDKRPRAREWRLAGLPEASHHGYFPSERGDFDVNRANRYAGISRWHERRNQSRIDEGDNCGLHGDLLLVGIRVREKHFCRGDEGRSADSHGYAS